MFTITRQSNQFGFCIYLLDNSFNQSNDPNGQVGQVGYPWFLPVLLQGALEACPNYHQTQAQWLQKNEKQIRLFLFILCGQNFSIYEYRIYGYDIQSYLPWRLCLILYWCLIYILSDDLMRTRSLPILKLQTSLQGVGNILKVLHHPFWKAIFLQTTSTFLLGDFAQLSVRGNPAQ